MDDALKTKEQLISEIASLSRQNHYLSSWYEASTLLLHSDPPRNGKDFFPVLEHICRAMNTPNSFLGLVENLDICEPNNGINFITGTGIFSQNNSVFEYISQQIWENRETDSMVLIDNSDVLQEDIRNVDKDVIIQSAIGVPLTKYTVVRGVLGVAFEEGTNQTFNAETFEFLDGFAGIISLRLEDMVRFGDILRQLVECNQLIQEQ